MRAARESLDAAPPSIRRLSSAALYGLHHTVEPILDGARGAVLDVGCGSMPFRPYFNEGVRVYHGLDIEQRGLARPDYVVSAEAMGPVPSEAYDFVLVSELLEHVRRPSLVLDEVMRVLVPGGRVVVTAPHLSRVHEAPNDYFRYTKYGLQSMLEEAGFQVDSITATGGLFSFLAHQVSMPLTSLFARRAVGLRVVTPINWLFFILPARLLDRVLSTARLFPLGHVAVADKPPDLKKPEHVFGAVPD